MKNHATTVSHIVNHVATVTHTSFYNSGAPLLIAVAALIVLMVWPRKRRG